MLEVLSSNTMVPNMSTMMYYYQVVNAANMERWNLAYHNKVFSSLNIILVNIEQMQTMREESLLIGKQQPMEHGFSTDQRNAN